MNTYMVFIDIEPPAIPIGRLWKAGGRGNVLKLKTKCSPGAYTMMLKCQSRGQPPNLQPR